jgi:ribosomal protein L12E/L44/L45/RPP1/RPP2
MVRPLAIAALGSLALSLAEPRGARADDDRMTRVRTSAVVEVLDDPRQVEDIISRLKSQPADRAREPARPAATPATSAGAAPSAPSATAAPAQPARIDRPRADLPRVDRPPLPSLPAREAAPGRAVSTPTFDRRLDPRHGSREPGREIGRRDARRR